MSTSPLPLSRLKIVRPEGKKNMREVKPSFALHAHAHDDEGMVRVRAIVWRTKAENEVSRNIFE